VPVSHRVFVGGLPRDATEACLTQFFGRFGKVVEFRIIYDPVTGASKGFGFASFVNRADAEAVRARKVVHYNHRTLNVGEAKLNPNNNNNNNSSSGGNNATAAAAAGANDGAANAASAPQLQEESKPQADAPAAAAAGQ
jgi:nucleolysin TIA-1/TIAR